MAVSVAYSCILSTALAYVWLFVLHFVSNKHNYTLNASLDVASSCDEWIVQLHMWSDSDACVSLCHWNALNPLHCSHYFQCTRLVNKCLYLHLKICGITCSWIFNSLFVFLRWAIQLPFRECFDFPLLIHFFVAVCMTASGYCAHCVKRNTRHPSVPFLVWSSLTYCLVCV